MMKQRNECGLNVWMICVLVFMSCATAFAQNSSGVLIGGAAGTLDNSFVSDLKVYQLGRSFDETYNYDLHVGYRYRLWQTSRLFWDLDALVGLKSIQKGDLTGFSDGYTQYRVGKRHLDYYIALSPTANLPIYKGLFAGVGIEPTAYVYRSKDSGMGFDLPAVFKVGYDFGLLGIEASVKVGLLRHSMDGLLEKNRKKEFQLSLYVPLWRR